MRHGQSIEIQLVDSYGKPLLLSNVIVALRFFTKGNYRYAFNIGRTNDIGRITVSYNDIEKQRSRNAEEYLMDYNTKLEDCDSTIRVVILPIENCASNTIM